MIKFKAARLHFLGDVFLAVTVVVAQAPFWQYGTVLKGLREDDIAVLAQAILC